MPEVPARLLDDEGTLTVAEVGRRIERAVRRDLPLPVWVRGEIHDLKRPRTGHVHLTLVGDGAALPVVLFSSDRPRINRSLVAAGNAVRMADGTEVRIRCEVRFFAPRGQVSLRMLAIDPAFTLGRLAEQRDALLRRLAAEGLLQAQQRLAVPELPLRVGLVTSLGSAAHADVVRTLGEAGIGWQVRECDASVQGPEAVPSIVAALRTVADSGVDVVCLVRGGGARTDLAAFDAEHLARAIAALPVPVLTGVGHETDRTVADEVAWARHVTPTACAAWLADRAGRWCERRDESLRRVLTAATTAASRASRRLDRRAAAAAAAGRRHVRHEGALADRAADRLATRASAAVARAGERLDHRAARAAAADPRRLLARGWSITRSESGELVRSVGDASAGTVVVTTVADGDLRSTVT